MGSRRVAALAITLAACADPGVPFVDAGPDGPEAPPETTLTVAPAAISNQALARFEFTGERAAGFRCRVDDGAEAACTSPLEVPVTDGPHTFEVAAVDASGAADPSPARHAWTVDTTPPDTTFDLVPAARDNSVTVRFEFHADEEATFACALDDAAPGPCTSAHELTGLTDGGHRFAVTATDRAGNVEREPAAHAWMIDTAAPDTQITAGPTGTVASTAARLVFSSPDAGPGASFACSLDRAAFTPCTSPRDLADLAQGAHRFEVRVTDATGNVDPTPAVRLWTVDTVAPVVTIAAPATPTRDATPTFTFTVTGEPTAIRCRFDTDPFTPCASPFTPAAALRDGDRTFDVEAVDAVGNRGSARRQIAIDTTPPQLRILTGVAEGGLTRLRTPTWTFEVTGGDPAQTRCALDGAALGACTGTGTHTAPTLADGRHTLVIRAADALGNEVQVTRAFDVDATPPTVTIQTGPAEGALINTRTPRWTFTTGGAPTAIECRLDSAAFAACTSSTTHGAPSLGDGRHTFEVRVTDAAGNQAAASRTFTVDATAPVVDITSGPTQTEFSGSARFTWTVSGQTGNVECAIYRTNQSPPATFTSPCTSPRNQTIPGFGGASAMFRFHVRARDAAGNVGQDTWDFEAGQVL